MMEAEKVAVSASVAKTNFLANMSHEIRTPLSAILGFAELMTNPEQTAAEHAHCIATIRRSGRQLLEIIDEFWIFRKSKRDIWSWRESKWTSRGLSVNCDLFWKFKPRTRVLI